MPFTQKLILAVPPLFLGTIMVIIPAFLSVAGILIMRRFIHHQKLKVHNDVAGPLFATLGVIYAVLLAFVVVVTWENFDRSSLNTEKEANYLVDLYTDAESFSPTVKLQLRTLLQEYTKTIIDDEWKVLSRGEASPRTEKILKEIWLLYSNYVPRNATEEIFFQESVQKLNEMCELRRMRIFDSRRGVHPLLWFVLILGGTVTIIFSFFFGSENLGAQIAMTTLLAVVIFLILFTILELDFPFSGSISIQPVVFKQISAFN
jgi:hypothetical protein